LANGQAQFAYTLPSAASSVDLMVEDASGNVVYSTTGNTAAGTHDFAWNGMTAAGVQMPDGGQYTLTVVAQDTSKNSMTATVDAFGTVSGVNVDNTSSSTSNSSSTNSNTSNGAT